MRPKNIVILTGQIASGKSTLADKLVSQYGFKKLKTTDVLKKNAAKNGKTLTDRIDYQAYGEGLDKSTNGRWVRDGLSNELRAYNNIVIDSCRIKPQIDAFRESFRSAVVHVHMTASEETLKDRFEERVHVLDNTANKKLSYQEVKGDKTEAEVTALEDDADLVIPTDLYKRSNDPIIAVAASLRLLPPLNERLVDVLIGGQFGSEGKGHIASYLAPEYDCLIRVGGPNAGHMVFADPPEKYQLLPSGTTRAERAKLVIGPGAVIDIDILVDEIHRYNIEPDRLIIDKNATIISKSNKTNEQRIDQIGSTKKGVGAATAGNLYQSRLKAQNKHKASQNTRLKQYIGDSQEVLSSIFASKKKILLEGTQGTLLSLHHGEYPHVTSRDTTVSGCLAEAGIPPSRVRKSIMVVRRYPIRVGNEGGNSSGEFGSLELSWREISERSGIPEKELRNTEKGTVSNKPRRVAEFSWELFRKACELNGPTDIAFTFSDYIDIANQDATRFDRLTPETNKFISQLELCSGVPVSLVATKFDFRSILDRRNWR